MRLYRTAQRLLNQWPFIIALAIACCILPARSADAEEREALALKLYGEGRYGEALPLLEELDREELADGPLLYRLYFCQRHVEAPSAGKTQERARQRLEEELGDSTDLETPFYLANVYRNIGRLTEMRRIALEATARVESGELPQPQSGAGMFQLGKLYADLGKDEQAIEWYSRAVEGLAGEDPSVMPPYASWAARYLADRAQARGDHQAAAKYYALLSSEDAASSRDFEKMATLAVMAGDYGRAAETWRRAAALNPAQADRSRYCARLAESAGQLGGLPDLSPDGRPWKELTQEDLSTVLSDKAKIIRETLAEVNKVDMLMRDLTASAIETLGRTGAVKKLEKSFETVWAKMIPERQARIDGARAFFIAAALEFAMKRYGLRETAFFGGFAPLIFGNEEWDIATRLQVNVASADRAEFATQADELIEAAKDILGEGQDLTKLERILGKVRKEMP